MQIQFRKLIAPLFLGFFGLGLGAQTPGTRLTVDVRVDSIRLRGDTTKVAYALSNRSDSQDSLIVFIVDAPARVTFIGRPHPYSMWLIDSLIRATQPAAFWSKLDLLAPSQTTSPLIFESVGLPAVVTNWVGGNWPLPTCCDDDPPGSAEDPLVTRSIQGKTVGVEAWPANRSAEALLARLRALTLSACTAPLNWIVNTPLCDSLVADLDAAENHRASGASSEAQAAVNQFKTRLTGPDPGTFATGVTSPGFWLLMSNADIVRAIF